MSVLTPSRLVGFGFAVLILGSAVLGQTATPAFAHDQLTGTTVVTDPSDGHVTGVTVSFNDIVQNLGAEFVAVAGDGTSIANGNPILTTERDVTLPLTVPARAAKYTITWRVVSADGHPITGMLALTVLANGSATVAPATESETVPPKENTSTPPKTEVSGVTIMLWVGGGIVVLAAATTIIAFAVGKRRRTTTLTNGTKQ